MKAKDSTKPWAERHPFVILISFGFLMFVLNLMQGKNLFNAARLLAIYCVLVFFFWIFSRLVKK